MTFLSVFFDEVNIQNDLKYNNNLLQNYFFLIVNLRQNIKSFNFFIIILLITVNFLTVICHSFYFSLFYLYAIYFINKQVIYWLNIFFINKFKNK